MPTSGTLRSRGYEWTSLVLDFGDKLNACPDEQVVTETPETLWRHCSVLL